MRAAAASSTVALQRTWKPDRDWNFPDGLGLDLDLYRCNELENPIGIETDVNVATANANQSVATNLKTR